MENSGQSDRARGSPPPQRGSAAGDQRPSPTRRFQEDQDFIINQDDSFSEERFLSGNSFPASSWESQSFDSEERSGGRPSSQPSMRDRRKFDPTTPTLIDEEELEEEEMLKLEQMRLQGFGNVKDDADIRRTPGAAMYKSAFDSDTDTSLRKTPGQASESGLGYALTLSTPVSGEEQLDDETKPGAWETSPVAGRSTSTDTTDQANRPPLPPTAAASVEKEAFAFQPWTKEGSTPASNTEERQQGAFSPRLLRLTEDIGNLLHEDEDDDYLIEVPGAFRAQGDEVDWTGSLVVDKNRPFATKIVPRVAMGSAPREGRSRRRAGASSGQGAFLPNAQQPKPRRGSNEVFQFGSAGAGEGSQPRQTFQFGSVSSQHHQTFQFGGAFAPPAKEFTGSFIQPAQFTGPIQSVPATIPVQPMTFHGQPDASFSAGQAAPQGQGYIAPTGHPAQSFGVPPGMQPLVNTLSFDSHQSGMNRGSPFDSSVEQYRFTTPSPSTMMAPGPYGTRDSDMQATAQEYYPMATRSASSTPLLPGQRWQHANQGAFDAPLDQGSWHSSTASFAGYGPNYGYGMQSPSFGDARAGMTPSPHLPMWHHGDPSVFVGNVQSRPEAIQSQYAAAPSPTTASTAAAQSASAADPSKTKKDPKKGKRVKKKGTKGDSSATSSVVGKKSQSTGKKKKGGEVRPSSTLSHDDCVSASDDQMGSRRAELEESPAVRLAFKEFYRAYRAEEQKSVQKAEEYAMNALEDGTIPESVHWRVYLELADLARRGNRFAEARRLYQKVCQLQPYASQGWVEYSKLEEECGHMNRVTNILHAGLEFCEYNENILIRALKHQERMGNLDQARGLMARLKHVAIEKVWRTMLEGALFEARAGNIVMARRVLKYIMHYVPWYGPLYVEFYRLERDHGHPLDALNVVERGLAQVPRYGPLWFSALRVCEELDFMDKNFSLPRVSAMLQRASHNVSKEIAWKVYLETSFMFERAAQEQALTNDIPIDGVLGPARLYFSLTIRTCRINLRWKVWLAAARMELAAGNVEKARTLFLRAHQVAPEKVRSLTFLDCARLHEFLGETEVARALLTKGRVRYGHDWKVWLESVLLEMRASNLMRSFELASNALEVHNGTGRLWAAAVQLHHHTGGDKAQYAALKRALNAVPKSGEVWCEGARIHLNPFSDLFDLDRARRHLLFAGKFTPQYGDSFLEGARLELLRQSLAPIAEYVWSETKGSFSPNRPSKEIDCLTKYITDVSLAIWVAMQPNDPRNMPRVVHSGIIPTLRSRLKKDELTKDLDLSEVSLQCSNADPNYGPLWFHCRQVQTDAPRDVVERAKDCMAEDVLKVAHVYLAAMIRRKAILSTVEDEAPPSIGSSLEVFDRAVIEWEDKLDGVLRSFPSLLDIFNPVDPTTGLVLLESTIKGSDFLTGLMECNKHRPIEQMSLLERKRVIFATDALFP